MKKEQYVDGEIVFEGTISEQGIQIERNKLKKNILILIGLYIIIFIIALWLSFGFLKQFPLPLLVKSLFPVVFTIVASIPLFKYIFFPGIIEKDIILEGLKNKEYAISAKAIYLFQEVRTSNIYKHYISVFHFQNIDYIRIIHVKDDLIHLEVGSAYIVDHIGETFHYWDLDKKTKEMLDYVPGIHDSDRFFLFYLDKTPDLIKVLETHYNGEIRSINFSDLPFRERALFAKKLC